MYFSGSALEDLIRVTIPSHPRYMRVLRGIVADAARVAGFDEKAQQDMALATTEGCTNIIKYGYNRDPDKKILVKCRIADAFVEVTLRDFGTHADPEKLRGRDLHDLRPGGLGIHLMRRLVDEVTYIHRQIGTELKLVKRKKRKEEG